MALHDEFVWPKASTRGRGPWTSITTPLESFKHVSRKPAFGREPIDKRPEANALHYAGDLKLAAYGRAPALRIFFLGWHERFGSVD